MSLEKAKADLEAKGFLDHVIELDASTATVTDAAEALGVKPAMMIPFDEVEQHVGHAPGGVCPFGIREGVEVYLDESLRQFDVVYPAAGNDHSAVKLTIPELEQVAGAKSWVDVTVHG